MMDDSCSQTDDFYETRPNSEGESRAEASKVKPTNSQILERLHQTEAALQESEARFKRFVQGSQDGFWDWDVVRDRWYVSDRWKQLRGIAPDATIADTVTTWYESTHPDERDRVLDGFRHYVAQGSGQYSEEYRIVQPDGTIVWVLDRGQATWDETGRAIRVTGSQTDITKLKRTEEALEESQLIYKTLADTMPQMFWITQGNGYHDYFNQRWYDYTGTKPGETDGEGWQTCLHPEDAKKAAVTWQECLKTGQPYNVEYRLRCAKTGEYRWHLGQALPLHDSDGDIVRWFGSCTDIHDQKLLIEERDNALERERAARLEQEKANRTKDEFLAVVSHELRSPLNPILGWIRLLRTRKMGEAQTQQALETIERNAKLQSQLIEDLLDVSRILRGKLALKITPVNLATVIESAIETVRLSAQAKNIQIQTRVNANLTYVSGDFNRLQQVVWNLLSNAVKFTPDHGTITIELCATDSTIDIRVQDTGKGIAPEFLPHVFEQFRQADSSITRQFGGLGLGLAIVRHIVERHQGQIRVESRGENQGATFIVELPLLNTPVNSAIAPLDHTPDEQLTGLSLLIVDDEADARELLAFLLEQQGAIVTATSSAKEAQAKLAKFQPDLLISDLGMPDVDGFQLIRQLRAEGRSIRAIAVTAYAREEDRQAALAAGFQAHVTKPIEPAELFKAIRAAVQK
ncbi:PAS domain-containing protein [Leptolyngbya sp. FACHB-17]|uniref:PAS domain-containing hybrid sensor histidine kinase/response regulator n=1 Tax=unclassified Leptolyngbya TaxID=2650499 RepID=UPI001680ED10|nr:PAS domain-containing protein [Leptolyngbya sp. FACHB-17]MBD2081982.1 PAS domain-containing protein [Leptolyngbya sp. FACHB-17]